MELPRTLDPEGDWRASLDVISLAAGTYTMFATFYLVCLDQRVAPTFFLISSGLADATMIAHFFVSCVTGFRKGSSGGGYVDGLKEGFRRYVKQGGFALDIVTSIPIVSVSMLAQMSGVQIEFFLAGYLKERMAH